jgi:SAM-dependent methyltransferase
MRLLNLIPNSFKPLVKRIFHSLARPFRKRMHHSESHQRLHEYWARPWDGANDPKDYLEGRERSQFLLEIIEKHVGRNQRILEIGCNVGRNLDHLFHGGFRFLSGVELNKHAVALLQEHFPEMAKATEIHVGSIEEIIPRLGTAEFDAVFTMAVLEHIHTDSEWIFPEMTRITRNFLITVEDEQHMSWRHFPRNYKRLFESFGLRQIDVYECESVEGLAGSGFMARVFAKRDVDNSLHP